MKYHLTQDDTGQMAEKAIASGNFSYFRQPVLLVLGKSHVPGSPTGDVFEGISNEPIPFAPAPGYRAPARSGLSLELGGPWAFYKKLWQAHGLDHLSNLLPNAETNLNAGETIFLPVLVHNDTDADTQVELSASLPEGWTELNGPGRLLVHAHQTFPVYITARAPRQESKNGATITIRATSGENKIGEIPVKVFLAAGSLPQ
jgi:hypothetical protein